mmetsp:Transcript_21431/g.42049  ORF Transcript_21431/g.42049 Transcript_21431/m.42049 type:complete len:208 (+) Transcript_21431:1341-1964(+)
MSAEKTPNPLIMGCILTQSASSKSSKSFRMPSGTALQVPWYRAYPKVLSRMKRWLKCLTISCAKLHETQSSNGMLYLRHSAHRRSPNSILILPVTCPSNAKASTNGRRCSCEFHCRPMFMIFLKRQLRKSQQSIPYTPVCAKLSSRCKQRFNVRREINEKWLKHGKNGTLKKLALTTYLVVHQTQPGLGALMTPSLICQVYSILCTN